MVSIALGTNDFSAGDGKKKRLVKTKYPEAQIALLSSPMLNGDARIRLQNCLGAIKTAIDLQPRGCYYHPSVEDHAILAD